MFEEIRFEDLLKSLRVRKGKVWTQAKTAKLLGVSLRTYVGWENGESLPSPRDLKNVAATFELNDADADSLFRTASQVAPEIQNLPFPQNPFFTGRESYLKHLDQFIKKRGSVAITQRISISGLGGIGKTQLALEYAHRCYPKVYRTVLWVDAADKVTLETSYLSLAKLLNVPEQNESEIDRIVQAVKIWLEGHINWLLIFDNAEDLQLARSFLPKKPRGHILLTTRSQIVSNTAARIEIEAMEPEEGLLFLLRRSGVLKHGIELETIAPDTRDAAAQLVKLLEGYPLALDQAGAYIEETRDLSFEATGVSFIEYMQIYQEQRCALLDRRGLLGDEHPETVAATFEISFKKACELYPACADVLYFCSFLHPDAIPEEWFGHEKDLKLNLLAFSEAMTALRRYSLIKRDAEKKLLFIHRLVQAVLTDKMSEELRKEWIVQVTRVLSRFFTNAEAENWIQCQRYILHVQTIVDPVERYNVTSIETYQLFNEAGLYLYYRGQYAEAQTLLQKALSIAEQLVEANHSDISTILGNLARLYIDQGKYEEAEQDSLRALSIYEQECGPDRPETAERVNLLGTLYFYQGRYEEAVDFFQRAISIWERNLGPDDPKVAACFVNLAEIYRFQGKFTEAETMLQKALLINEQVQRNLGGYYFELGTNLNNLATLRMSQNRFDEAEALLLHALLIREQALGANHTDVAQTLNNLAAVYGYQGKCEEAKPLYKRAIAIYENAFGPDHPELAAGLCNLGKIYKDQSQYEEAEHLYQRALTIDEKALGANHFYVANDLNNLARLYQAQHRYEEAEPLYQRALAITEKTFGADHDQVKKILESYRSLLHEMDREEEAMKLSKESIKKSV